MSSFVFDILIFSRGCFDIFDFSKSFIRDEESFFECCLLEIQESIGIIKFSNS
nr:MAG TPA: hypothetical protein [Caudoviricetes sp.]DAX56963.1 MAG TPA: hypothetical protein [Caudoviricetes sp.]